MKGALDAVLTGGLPWKQIEGNPQLAGLLLDAMANLEAIDALLGAPPPSGAEAGQVAMVKAALRHVAGRAS